MKTGAERQRFGGTVLDHLFPVQSTLIEPVGQTETKRERVTGARTFGVGQLQGDGRGGLFLDRPPQAPSEAVLRHLKDRAIPFVVMVAVANPIVAHQREQNRNAGVHLARITIHNGLGKMQRFHQTLLREMARIPQKPAAEFGRHDRGRAVGVRQREKGFVSHGDCDCDCGEEPAPAGAFHLTWD